MFFFWGVTCWLLGCYDYDIRLCGLAGFGHFPGPISRRTRRAQVRQWTVFGISPYYPVSITGQQQAVRPMQQQETLETYRGSQHPVPIRAVSDARSSPRVGAGPGALSLAADIQAATTRPPQGAPGLGNARACVHLGASAAQASRTPHGRLRRAPSRLTRGAHGRPPAGGRPRPLRAARPRGARRHAGPRGDRVQTRGGAGLGASGGA